MLHTPLRGLIAAPFTPMNDDGSINLSVIPAYYQFLKANGVTGAFILGSTGEGVSVSLEEKKQVTQAWASVTKNDTDFHLMCFLGGTCLTDCKALAQFAHTVGVDAVSFTAPFYFKPSNVQQLANCCKEIADAVPEMPFYYYHIPVLTGVGFPMIDLLQLVHEHIPNFAGIKYTHEDFMDYISCLHFADGQYGMLWGRDENMLAALAVGAPGAVGSTFNYAAPLYQELIGAFNENNLPKARALQQQSIDMIRLLGKYGGIATGKAFMKAVGINCGNFRLPVQNMDASQLKGFESDLAKIAFYEYCSKKPASAQLA